RALGGPDGERAALDLGVVTDVDGEAGVLQECGDIFCVGSRSGDLREGVADLWPAGVATGLQLDAEDGSLLSFGSDADEGGAEDVGVCVEGALTGEGEHDAIGGGDAMFFATA